MWSKMPGNWLRANVNAQKLFISTPMFDATNIYYGKTGVRWDGEAGKPARLMEKKNTTLCPTVKFFALNAGAEIFHISSPGL
jgi:hypothetical protein